MFKMNDRKRMKGTKSNVILNFDMKYNTLNMYLESKLERSINIYSVI